MIERGNISNEPSILIGRIFLSASIAILVDNRSFTAMMPVPLFPLPGGRLNYNDVVRQYADALYKCNVEYDVIFPKSGDFSSYDLLIVPSLYCAPENLLNRMKTFVRNGGTLLSSIKCGFSDENVKVYQDAQPHLLRECFGMSYQEFTVPGTAGIKAEPLFADAQGLFSEGSLHTWIELLQPEGTDVLAWFDHPSWGRYAAIMQNRFGEGTAIYAGCLMDEDWTKALVRHSLRAASISAENADLYPVVIKSGINRDGNTIHYYLNYSSQVQTVPYRFANGTELLKGTPVHTGASLTLTAWDCRIVEEVPL